jgi:glycosyltransferase involved in cell wall biosynthesis
MASKLARIAQDPALRRDLRAKGCARAAVFSWERAARETLAVYQRVLRPPPRP